MMCKYLSPEDLKGNLPMGLFISLSVEIHVFIRRLTSVKSWHGKEKLCLVHNILYKEAAKQVLLPFLGTNFYIEDIQISFCNLKLH